MELAARRLTPQPRPSKPAQLSAPTPTQHTPTPNPTASPQNWLPGGSRHSPDPQNLHNCQPPTPTQHTPTPKPTASPQNWLPRGLRHSPDPQNLHNCQPPQPTQPTTTTTAIYSCPSFQPLPAHLWALPPSPTSSESWGCVLGAGVGWAMCNLEVFWWDVDRFSVRSVNRPPPPPPPPLHHHQ